MTSTQTQYAVTVINPTFRPLCTCWLNNATLTGDDQEPAMVVTGYAETPEEMKNEGLLNYMKRSFPVNIVRGLNEAKAVIQKNETNHLAGGST